MATPASATGNRSSSGVYIATEIVVFSLFFRI